MASIESDTTVAERTAVVVAGDDSIGRACAVELAARGYRIILVGHDPDPVCDEIIGAGGRAEPVPAELDDPEACARAAFDAASSAGAVHALVNCHFWIQPADLERLTRADWERSLRINLTGPLVTTSALLPLLKAAEGAAVVHLGSVDGLFGNPHVVAYSAAKGGLIPLTHVQAHELAPHRIRVNCVARALVTSSSIAVNDRTLQRVVAQTPLARGAEPREIASVVAFLVSDDAAYITGSVLTVDGGRTGITRGTA